MYDTTTQALKLLMQDHRRLRRLIRAALREIDPPALHAGVALACAELRAHADIEQRLLYPAVESALRDDVIAARLEHGIVDGLMDSLASIPVGDARFLPTFRVLAAYVDQHATEEEAGLLARAKQTGVDLSAIAEALVSRQREGGLCDVDLEALDADASNELPAFDPSEARQRERVPGRGGAH